MSDPDVKWDVFLSYAHVDNAEGWVERFHKQLSIKLDQLGGRAGEIQIWRDPRLDEATVFDEVIRKRVEQSAVFLALCSRGYKRSDYCRHEADTFRARYGEERMRVGERVRLVRARLHNIPWAELPGTAERTGAFDFFTTEGDDDIGTRLETDAVDFRTRIDRLARVVYLILEDLRAQSEGGRAKAGAEPAAEPAAAEVFLAEVCDPQRTARDRLSADLIARGVTVAQAIPPPHAAQDHERAARRALGKARLSVHLFDAWSDNPLPGAAPGTSYGREQLRLGQELGVPQLVWIHQRVPLGQAAPSASADAAWVAFLNELESARREQGQYQVVRCPPSELAPLVAARIGELRRPRRWPEEAPAVLLDTHVKDHLVAFDVCKALLEGGVRPDLIAQQDDPRENTALFAERLQGVRGLMVLYGRASEEWVRARLDEGRKLMVTAPGGPRFCGVLLAPPGEGKSQAAFEHPLFKTHVLDIRQGLSPGALGPVLQGLGAG